MPEDEPGRDETAVNDALPDDPDCDIDDDVGIESFEDGENYPLENDGDDDADDE